MKLTNENNNTSIEYCKAYRVMPEKVPTLTYKGSGDPLYRDCSWFNPDLIPEGTGVWIERAQLKK